MSDTYTIPYCNRADVEKEVNKYMKKAAKYGTQLSFAFGDAYVKDIPTYDIDGTTMFKTGTVKVEVFDLTITGDIICKDGFTVIAQLEHLEGGNIVKVFADEVKPEWRHMDTYCEHCSSRRNRKMTYIVRHQDGSEKQVGSTCLKDYCGINPQGIGWRNEIIEFVNAEDINHVSFDSCMAYAYDTVDMLAFACEVYKAQGYIKSSDIGANKDKLFDMVKKGATPSEDALNAAKGMNTIISAIDEDDARFWLLDNVQVLLKSGYCKVDHFGFIAYAPVAFKKYMDAQAKRQAKAAANEAHKGSQYVGQIGDRMTFALSNMELVTSWQTQFGYTYLYKFITTDGNVLVWFASKTIANTNAITGTVKDHTERDGVKQTVITRCKAG